MDSDLKLNIEDIKQQFLKDGFAVIQGQMPSDFIDSLHEKVVALASRGEIDDEKRDIHRFENGEISSIHNIVQYLPDYLSLQNHEIVQRVFRGIYGEPSAQAFNSSYFAKPRLIGAETKIHQDNAYFCMDPAEIITFWIPVEFSSKENGALYYLPQSQVEGDISHVPEGNLGASMCIAEEDAEPYLEKYDRVYVELQKGDCLIHDARVLHGSDANNSNYDRNAFNFSICSKRSRRDEKAFKSYKGKLNDFLERKKTS